MMAPTSEQQRGATAAAVACAAVMTVTYTVVCSHDIDDTKQKRGVPNEFLSRDLPLERRRVCENCSQWLRRHFRAGGTQPHKKCIRTGRPTTRCTKRLATFALPDGVTFLSRPRDVATTATATPGMEMAQPLAMATSPAAAPAVAPRATTATRAPPAGDADADSSEWATGLDCVGLAAFTAFRGVSAMTTVSTGAATATATTDWLDVHDACVTGSSGVVEVGELGGDDMSEPAARCSTFHAGGGDNGCEADYYSPVGLHRGISYAHELGVPHVPGDYECGAPTQCATATAAVSTSSHALVAVAVHDLDGDLDLDGLDLDCLMGCEALDMDLDMGMGW